MLKKLTLVAFAVLALATFSACDDGGGEEADGKIIQESNDTYLGIEGSGCKLDGTCNSGLTCSTAMKICIKLLPICEGEGCDDTPEPAPECAVDADCGADKLCNSGKCEDIGGGGDGGSDGNGSGGTGGGATVVNIKTHVTLRNSIALLAGSGNFCPAGCPAGQECKNNKCVDIPSVGGAGQGDSTAKLCMAECKPGSTCINGICTSLINLPKEKIVVIENGGSNELQPDTGAGGSPSGGSGEDEKECANDASCQAGQLCKAGICIDDINKEVATSECTINGAKGVIDENGNCSATDPCKLNIEIEPTMVVPPPPNDYTKAYHYNTSMNVGFWVKDAKPSDKIKWTVSRNTAVFWTKSDKHYVDKWNEDVPIDSSFCLNGEYCSFEVNFRLGNSNKGNGAKRALSLIEYFRHKITVTATLEQDQCAIKSVTATKELKFKFNKPKLEDEVIDGATLAFKTYVEWTNNTTGLSVYVEDGDHHDLGLLGGMSLAGYEESHFKKLMPLINLNSSTFKDVEFFEWEGNDTLSPWPDLYFNLNYLMLAGKDIYAVVESGWDKMHVNGIFESWHWKVGEDIHWYMRCQPDDAVEEEPACGEDEGGGNM